MKKIVINTCFGGFGLSDAAMLRIAEIKQLKVYPETATEWPRQTIFWLVPPEQRLPNPTAEQWQQMTQEERVEHNRRYNESTLCGYRMGRDDPALVQAVEKLGKKADGQYAALKVVEIPDDVEWEIDEYDGSESVEEVHRSWR